MIRDRILWATVGSWLRRIVAFSTGFFLTPFIVHHLGDTQYGLYVLAGSVVAQGVLLDFGVKYAITKFVSEYHARGDYSRLRSLLATALWLNLFLALVVLVLAAVVAAVFPIIFNVPLAERSTAIRVMFLMGAQAAMTLPTNVAMSVLWGLHRYGAVNGLLAAETLMWAAMVVTVLLAGGGVTAVVAIGIPLTLITQSVAVFIIRRAAPEIGFGLRGARGNTIRAVLTYSGSMYLIDFAGNVQARGNEIVIGAFLPVSSVSPYSIARRLGNLPQMVGELCLGAFVPVSSQLHAEGDLERLRALYIAGTRMTLAVSVPIATALITLAAPLLTVWVGVQYAGYAPIVLLLAFASLADISRSAGAAILQGMARHHGLAVATVVAALANITLSLLLVRYLGLIGIALGTLIPTILLTLGYVWPYAAIVIGVSVRDLVVQAALPGLAPALPMAACMYAIARAIDPSGLIAAGLTVSVGLLTYAVIYLAFCAGSPEIKLLQSAIERLKGLTSSFFAERGSGA